MLFINVATFIKLRMVHRSSIKNSGNVANGFDAKRRLEIRFFVQVSIMSIFEHSNWRVELRRMPSRFT
ncbi:hypothetical protein OESDEN_22321 [Oesophagostomum dentatum]|uniref:Uncharacterized protein n=1 Tax=Oesophagostomum dentatum TaxID=61180 RepID=A0A0B1RZG2_OESDE|nr:hypothetical protein OESDEN_22321 [Oesophagostomum dentatum]